MSTAQTQTGEEAEMVWGNGVYSDEFKLNPEFTSSRMKGSWDR